MPGAHRDTDNRFCEAATIVQLQGSVYVNDLLWAVEGDIDTHCNEGALIPITGSKDVHCEDIKVIVAVGDTAKSDREGCVVLHPAGTTDPLGHSPDTNAY